MGVSGTAEPALPGSGQRQLHEDVDLIPSTSDPVDPRKRRRQRWQRLDLTGAGGPIKASSATILFEHPEVHAPARVANGRGASRQQSDSESVALAIVSDVEVVDERTPTRVVVRDDMDETDELSVELGQDRVSTAIARQTVSPGCRSIGIERRTEELLWICEPVVTAPAVGVEPSDVVRVVGSSGSETQHLVALNLHTTILDDPRPR